MTISKRMVTVVLTIVMLVSLIPAAVFAAGINGWKEESGVWHYYKDGVMLKTQWLKDGKKWYYFDSTGRMLADVHTSIEGPVYYIFDKSGAMLDNVGWYMYKGTWFYVNKGGKLAQGWKKINRKWYYFHVPGYMYSFPTGVIEGKMYVFREDGSNASSKGWVNVNYSGSSYWFYVKKDGTAATEWTKIGGKWYFFVKENGIMIHNCTREWNGKVYEFDANGVCKNP